MDMLYQIQYSAQMSNIPWRRFNFGVPVPRPVSLGGSGVILLQLDQCGRMIKPVGRQCENVLFLTPKKVVTTSEVVGWNDG